MLFFISMIYLDVLFFNFLGMNKKLMIVLHANGHISSSAEVRCVRSLLQKQFHLFSVQINSYVSHRIYLAIRLLNYVEQFG